MPNDNNNQAANPNDQVLTTSDDQTPKINPVVEEVLPPMPSTNQTPTVESVQDKVNDATDSNPSTVDLSSGSAAPSQDLLNPQVMGTVMPKKKFAGGRVIATILGLFLLVGGVGAGIILTSQNQDVRKKAAVNNWKAPCTETGCTANDFPEHWVNHYRCNDIKLPNENCSDIDVALAVKSASFQFNCGTEQIDLTGSEGFTSIRHDEPCTGGPQCFAVLALYDMNDNRISDMNSLKAGQKIFITVPPSYKTLTAEKTRFTVNGVLGPEISTKRNFGIVPLFYQEYTVKSGQTTVKAEMYYQGKWY